MSRFLRLPQVEESTGLTRSGIYEGMAAGTFPSNFKITERAVGWLEEEVEAWKRARLVAAGKAKAAEAA